MAPWNRPQARVNTVTDGVPAHPYTQTVITAQATEKAVPSNTRPLTQQERYKQYLSSVGQVIQGQMDMLDYEHNHVWKPRRKALSVLSGVATPVLGYVALNAVAVGATAVLAPVLVTAAVVTGMTFLATKIYSGVKNAIHKHDMDDFQSAINNDIKERGLGQLQSLDTARKDNPNFSQKDYERYIEGIDINKIASRMEDFTDIAENRTHTLTQWSKGFHQSGVKKLKANAKLLEQFRGNTRLFAHQNTEGEYKRVPPKNKANRKYML
jgi:hypothetical protein